MTTSPSPLAIFRAKGIPHRRMEDWKYTDLRSVVDVKDVEQRTNAVATRIESHDSIELLNLAGDLPDWATQRLNLFPAQSAMDAAARAFGQSENIIWVRADANRAQPMRIDYRSFGSSRIVLFVEELASLTLIETQNAKDEGFQNLSLSIFLGEGAQLTHVRCAPYTEKLVSVETVTVVQQANSKYRLHLVQGGGKLSRFELNVELAGENADVGLSGVTVVGDGAHADLTTHIDHKVGHTKSTQLFKTVASGKSRGIYQGKITVREGADVSDSRQTAKGLLLGPRAEIDLKPELEILADDVKCAHGAAVGDLDKDSLFYLRARGIPEAEARALLIRAFLEEAVEGVAREDIRASLWQFVEEGLARAIEAVP